MQRPSPPRPRRQAEDLQIAETIASAWSYSGRLVTLPDADVYPPPVGSTPWSVQHPFVLDMTGPTAPGYRAETEYAPTVGPICDWLTRATEGKDWRACFQTLPRTRSICSVIKPKTLGLKAFR
jgi:hypothetical protein